MHPHCQSDTWFLANELTGVTAGRRPGESIVADFHTMTLFDLDDGTYGAFTDYDMPPTNMAAGTIHEMFAAPPATWR